ncbi:MAG: DUF4287 domain-containing protein [Cypionkella sp.]
MSFQAYLDTVQTKTGKSAEDFRGMAVERGFAGPDGIAPGIKATQITDWLQADFDLGHGHAMVIFAFLKGKKE